MKIVVAVLLVLNVAFLGWNVYRAGGSGAGAAGAGDPVDAAAPAIALVTEIDESELRERLRAAPETESVVVAGAAGAERPEGASVEGVVEQALPATEDTLSEDGAIAAAEGPARPDPAPIEEVLAAVMPATGATDPDAEPCFSVGPLTSPEEVAAVSDWLESQGGRSALREDERRELALYWVFIPPMESRQAAETLVERMRGQGIGDIYIIPRGDQANAISLGVYSRRISLERRLDQLRSRGHEPSITPRYRTKKASWFDVAFAQGFDFRASGFTEAFPALEMSPGPCPATLGAAPATAGERVAANATVPYDRGAPRRRFLYSGPAPTTSTTRP